MFTHLQQLQRITIWGVGLIGGSLGLALKANGFKGERVGLGRRLSTLKQALARDAVDVITTDIAAGIRDAELVVLGTPVQHVPGFVARIAECAVGGSSHSRKPDGAQGPGHREPSKTRIVVTDVGSTKVATVKAVEERLIPRYREVVAFVGGHPMAGSHETGVGAARATLFENAKCILTPTGNTDRDALQRIEDLWKFVGAVPYRLSPEAHDLLIGAASHLPHLIASLLTNSVAGVETGCEKALDYTATGFRDTTRIAAGSPEMWTGIFTQNTEVLSALINGMVDNLIDFKNLLQTDNHAEIERVLTEAKTYRETLRSS